MTRSPTSDAPPSSAAEDTQPNSSSVAGSVASDTADGPSADASIEVSRQWLGNAQTFLFVPGNRPDRFAKAVDTGADVVVIDLEDAVGSNGKAAAREAVSQWLAEHPDTLVRINASGTAWFDADVAALAQCFPMIMLPKATPSTVAALVGAMPSHVPIVALIETAAGVLQASVVAAHPQVVRLALGNVDLGAEIGADPADRQALLTARSHLVLSSAAAGIPAPIDGVTVAVGDPREAREDMRHAGSLGFTAKLCIHPRQVVAVHEALLPSQEDLDYALRIVKASTDGDVAVLDGKMIDRPVVLRARRIIALARSTS